MTHRDTDPPVGGTPAGLVDKITATLKYAREPLSQTEVVARVGGTRVAVIRSVLAWMIDQGYVNVSPGAHRSRLHELVPAFALAIERLRLADGSHGTDTTSPADIQTLAESIQAVYAQMQPFRVRVENLRLPANVSAGMNALRLCALVYRLRGTTDEPEPPIEVIHEPDGTWRIHDGRHRFLAAVIAGRPDVLCTEVP